MRRFALVLHTHLPYVRHNGTWPCGEDFFHQAAVESYLPLLGVFERLAARGLRDLCTIGVTPVLAHQMADAHMTRELQLYLGRYELRAMRQVANITGADAAPMRELAALYALVGREQLERLSRHGTLAAGFASLERRGIVELAGGPATHPLLTHIGAEWRDAQLRCGLDEHARLFGRRPQTVWLPECAVAPGIDDHLVRAGVRRLVVDPAALGNAPTSTIGTGLRAFAIDRGLMSTVWSPDGGYPAGEWYRDFHAYDLLAGFKNWRVTSRELGWLGKKLYEPTRSADAVAADARAFIERLEAAFDDSGIDTLIASFDTELFGHWWFEGPAWIEAVLTQLAEHPQIRPASLATIDGLTPDVPARELRPSTWGAGSGFDSWIDPETEPIFKRLHDAEEEAALLLRREIPAPAAAQLVRELFLMQSSDWPYLVVAGTNAEYARSRFESHAERFERIADAIRAGDTARANGEAAVSFASDNLLPGLQANPAAWEDAARRSP